MGKNISIEGIRDDVPIEADEVGHRTYGKVDHDIHPAGMYLVDESLVRLDVAVMGIEHGKVERGVTCNIP